MTTLTKSDNVHSTVWTLDPAHLEIGFAVRHMMIATVRGRFGSATGTVTVDEQNPANSRVEISIDVASIDTRQDVRDNHLRSPDFFDAATHPVMRFVSKRIEGDVTNKFRVVGDLTIRDIVQEVTLDATNEGRATDPWGNERMGVHATAKLNRAEFNLTWNQALEAGGVLVGDEVKLSIDAELVRQQAQVSAAA
jgi:polyisoprenoid-binding protein YceI